MGMSGLLALCVHLFSFAEVERAGCRLAPARPLLKDDNQLAGFHPVDPFNENVINSARPPMLSTGTGPPSPSSSRLTRLSAGRTGLSPIRNRGSEGIDRKSGEAGKRVVGRLGVGDARNM